MEHKKALRLNFTKRALESLAPPQAGRLYVYDAEGAGLGVCVTEKGVKTFFRGGRINGRPERLTIGTFPGVSVEQARKEARKLSGQVAQGGNPQDRRRAARAEMTVAEMFGLYVENAKSRKRTWQADVAQYDRYLTAWRTRLLSSIHQADVAALHAKVGRDHGRYSANRLVALVSAMFNYAASVGYEGVNPAKGVKKFREQARDRFLQPDELPRFFAALDAEPVALWRDFIGMLLWTGARRSNVQAMKWADVDLAHGLWSIPGAESKNGEPMPTILAVPALEILRHRHEENGTGEYVFPSANGHHVTEPKKPWAALVKRAGLEGLRMHDMRRTLASWQARAGVSLAIVGRSLGHRSMAATEVYARLDTAPVRVAVEGACRAILDASAVEPLALLPDAGK